MVIPAMDVLDQYLTDYSLNPTYALPIRAAVKLGKKTLNRYYSRTDDSKAYRIAMSTLHFI